MRGAPGHQAMANPALLDLPWELPLESWPSETIAALPKDISRHLVRFAHLSGHVVAAKETTAELARGEYEMLRMLQRLEIPCVEPVAAITNRTDAEGEALKPVLVTRHLRFSLPYRALFSARPYLLNFQLSIRRSHVNCLQSIWVYQLILAKTGQRQRSDVGSEVWRRWSNSRRSRVGR